MATHGVLYNPKTRQTVYVHYDGYPAHMLPTLANHYQTPEAVDALFAYTKSGDLSALVENLTDCVRYADGDVMFDRPFNALAAARKACCDFLYTWDGGGTGIRRKGQGRIRGDYGLRILHVLPGTGSTSM